MRISVYEIVFIEGLVIFLACHVYNDKNRRSLISSKNGQEMKCCRFFFLL